MITLLLICLLSTPEELLQGIDTLSYAARYERWKEIDRLDPALKSKLRPTTPYQRFVVAAQIAGFGTPTVCGPTAAKDTPLESFLALFRGTPKVSPTCKIAIDPALKTLKVTIAPDPGHERTAQDTLWEIMQAYYLDFRIRPDGTFYIIQLEI